MSDPIDRKSELKKLLRLAGPLAVAQVAHGLLGIVDTFVVAPLGSASLSAVGLANACINGIVYPLSCVLLSLDTEVSHAVGRKEHERAKYIFGTSLTLAAFVSVVSMVLVSVLSGLLPRFGIHPDIAPLAQSYLTYSLPGTAAISFTFAATKFLQSHERTRPIIAIAILDNILNYFLVSALAFGKWGFPNWGIVGAGAATSLCRVLMAVAYGAILARHFSFPAKAFIPDFKILRRLLQLGIPASLQIGLEVGLFVVASFLVARTTTIWMAAHQIVLQVATFSFMFPLSLSSAAAVLVGQAFGRGDKPRAFTIGSLAISAGALFMALSGVLFWVFGDDMGELFGAGHQVSHAIRALVFYAALFQLFDGIQVTATGALRGIGDTKTAFIANLVGHWLIALPAAIGFGFYTSMGPPGVWLGLTLGLISVALVLVAAWRHAIVKGQA